MTRRKSRSPEAAKEHTAKLAYSWSQNPEKERLRQEFPFMATVLDVCIVNAAKHRAEEREEKRKDLQNG